MAMRFGIPVTALRRIDEWQLVREGPTQTLGIHGPGDRLRLALDVREGALRRRLQTVRRDQPLPRAVGLHRRLSPPRLIDATAGLCRDAMVLAQLGCFVLAIERVPALAALCAAAVARSPFADRLEVVTGNAETVLRDLAGAQRPDVVYLDPMHADPGRAEVKKDMQVCRALAGPPGDLEPLFAAAMSAARERVVVKRHPHGIPIGGKPSHTVAAERVHFDVYLCG